MSIVNMLKGIVRWAIINSMSDDDKDFPIHQVEYMGKRGDAVSWYPYGYHANPGKETLALMLAVGANSENRVVMPGSPKERIDESMPTPLKEGEVIMFHPTTKTYVHFLEDGTIDIDSQKDVNIRVAGNALLDVDGNLSADVEGDITLDAAGDANIIAGGDVDIDATASIEMDAVDVIINASGSIKTLCGSTQFQNAAGTDDLHDIVRDLAQAGDTFNVDGSGYQSACVGFANRAALLR